MPELPDITIYLEALERRIVGERLLQVRVASPFLLRSFEPPLSAVEGKIVRRLRRLGKRIALGLDDDLWLVLHLMIAGRLHWKPAGAKLAGKYNLAAFDFHNGSLVLTEAGAKRRAATLRRRRRSGAGRARRWRSRRADGRRNTARAPRCCRDNHTLKRALADPSITSGIGNAYSDEILHRAD